MKKYVFNHNKTLNDGNQWLVPVVRIVGAMIYIYRRGCSNNYCIIHNKWLSAAEHNEMFENIEENTVVSCGYALEILFTRIHWNLRPHSFSSLFFFRRIPIIRRSRSLLCIRRCQRFSCHTPPYHIRCAAIRFVHSICASNIHKLIVHE